MKIKPEIFVPLSSKLVAGPSRSLSKPVYDASRTMRPYPGQHKGGTLQFLRNVSARKPLVTPTPFKTQMIWARYKRSHAMLLLRQAIRKQNANRRRSQRKTGLSRMPVSVAQKNAGASVKPLRIQASGLSADLEQRFLVAKGVDPDKTADQNWTELQRRFTSLKGLDPDKSTEQTWGELQRRFAILKGSEVDKKRK